MGTKAGLPDPIPVRGAEATDTLEWINDALYRGYNPLVSVHRYGYALDSLILLRFENGEWIRCRQRDLFRTGGLRHVLGAYDGNLFPDYSQASLDTIVSRLVWISSASVSDDQLEAFLVDIGNFLQRTLALKGGLLRRDYARDGYATIADLAHVNRNRTGGLRDGFPPAFVLDLSAEALWVPRGPLLTYLRESRAKADHAEVKGLLELVGWQSANFQRRQPGGDRRPHARVWIVPTDWDRCPFDLANAIADAP